MRNVVITTDSGCNPKNISNMLPVMVFDSNGNNYYDMIKVDLTSDISAINYTDVFERAVNGEKFHTASPNINDYIIVQKKLLDAGYDVVHLSMSGGISAGSVNASMVASRMLNDEYNEERVDVIDTLTAGGGGTVINEYANYLASQNLSKKEIVNELENVKKRILATFYISKVEGFVSSGRAPATLAISDKLSFRYRVDINQQGKLFPKMPPFRGSVNSQFMKYLKSIINENNITTYDPNYLAFIITRMQDIDLEEAKKYIDSFNYFKPVHEMKFYSGISSYGVIDQVGIGLIKKK